MTMGHRIAVMQQGKLQQVGSPLEVYERPANLFVAGFIGSPPMNLLPGTLTGQGTAVATSGFELRLPPRLAPPPRGHEGRNGGLGLRPQHAPAPAREGAAAGPRP